MTTCPRCGKETEMPFHTCKTVNTKSSIEIAELISESALKECSAQGTTGIANAQIKSLVDLARAVKAELINNCGPSSNLIYKYPLVDALARVEKLVDL